MKAVASSALTLTLAATTAMANPPLRDVTHVTEGIIAVGMALEISEKCDSLSARTLRGLSFLNSLKNHASDLGYSDAEIDAYVDDRTEKARLEGLARLRLSELGAVQGDAESYCRVGRAQIAQGTQVGRLLR